METICSKTSCTGCGLCEMMCPHQSISMLRDDLDVLYPSINHTTCVDCGLCKKKCPANNNITGNTPRRCYAAWSNNTEVRKNGASGGIASELYYYALANGWYTAGVALNEKSELFFVPVENKDDICKVRNSKYVQANHNGIYKAFKNELLIGRECLFIGLPCQVAALKSYLGKDYPNLYTCDIICHGVPPVQYLQSHINSIEQKYNFKHSKCFFRDPKKGTESFFFSLWSGDKLKYARNSQSNDLFQMAYHGALIYRENCYQCKYAKGERMGDITIGDFDGLGTKTPFNYYRYQLSCVLANTNKGEELINDLGNNIIFIERDIDEAINNQRQLRSPASPHPERNKFVELYLVCHDFESSARAIFKRQMRTNTIKRILVWEPIRFLQLITPQCFRNFIKIVLRHVR